MKAMKSPKLRTDDRPKMPTGAIGWIKTMPKKTRSLTVSSRFSRAAWPTPAAALCDSGEPMLLVYLSC